MRKMTIPTMTRTMGRMDGDEDEAERECNALLYIMYEYARETSVLYVCVTSLCSRVHLYLRYR